MSVPDKITSAPEAFSEQSAKINEIIEAITPILNAIGAGRLKITKAGTNWVFSITPPSTPSDVVDGGVGEGGGGGGGGLPAGATGDMLYYDGTNWVVLVAPSISISDAVLRHDGIAPYWEEPEDC